MGWPRRADGSSVTPACYRIVKASWSASLTQIVSASRSASLFSAGSCGRFFGIRVPENRVAVVKVGETTMRTGAYHINARACLLTAVKVGKVWEIAKDRPAASQVRAEQKARIEAPHTSTKRQNSLPDLALIARLVYFLGFFWGGANPGNGRLNTGPGQGIYASPPRRGSWLTELVFYH